MTKLHILPTALAVLALTAAAGAPAAVGAETCPNAQLRFENSSAALPDCRAYELVTPDSNHAASVQGLGLAAPSGDMIVYITKDAPDQAKSAQGALNFVRAVRDPDTGWSGVSLSPPLSAPTSSFGNVGVATVSPDLSSTLVVSDTPLIAGPVPSGKNIYIGRPDGSYRLVTKVGAPFFSGINGYPQNDIVGWTPDLGHLYFQAVLAQIPSDPLSAFNTYEWSEEHGLQLIGILPDGTPAPGGALLEAFSEDGKYVMFTAEGKLYLRTNDSQTVEVGASQRTVNPDPNPAVEPAVTGMSADGSKVLLTSSSELTNDANTGESAGVATDAGRDLYSYDTQTGKLTDLTVDSNPADAATGAKVQGVLATTSDGSRIYFTATGDLAPGATPGQSSLYLWHDGDIEFVAKTEDLAREGGSGFIIHYMTPDGRHILIGSTVSLTGYDNADPLTGQLHLELFELTPGSGIVCVSCRPDGSRPTGDSTIPIGAGHIRIMSDDGRRVFFNSTDAIIPQVSNGLQQVFEYAEGKVAPISPVDGPSAATFTDASASGDDVFFETYDELVPSPVGGDDAIYDARVDGGFPLSARQGCSGVACRGPLSPAPVLGAPASTSSSGAGNLTSPVSPTMSTGEKPKSAAQTRAEKLTKALKACRSKHNKNKRAKCEKQARHAYGRHK